MTIKFMYGTDLHGKGINPSTRTDDFPDTVDRKLMEYFEIGHQHEVDFFAFGGDLVDSPWTSPRYVIRLGKILREHARGKTIYSIWGNHDEEGWNPNSVSGTSLGIFQEFSGCYQMLNREPLLYENAQGEKVKLSGVHAHPTMDRDVLDKEGDVIRHRSEDYVIKDYDGTPHIHIVHGMLMPKPILDDIPHTLVSEMNHTKATVTLTGHDHTGFAPIKTDYGYIYNPGAMTRVFASHTEMNRMPQVALITIEKGEATIQPIQLKSAQRGEDVMDRTLLDEKKKKEALLKAAGENIQEVLSTMNVQHVDLETVVTGFKDQIEEDVYNEVSRRLDIR